MQAFPIELGTDQLLLSPILPGDADFIFELLNSDGWKKFIGDRNIHNLDDAKSYIEKINANKDLRYWKVVLRESQERLGVVTIIQRDYLDDLDLGFAFLPQMQNKGYAKAGSLAIIRMIKELTAIPKLAAVSNPSNRSSIYLLESLGFNFKETIQVNQEQLALFELQLDTFAVKK